MFSFGQNVQNNHTEQQYFNFHRYTSSKIAPVASSRVTMLLKHFKGWKFKIYRFTSQNILILPHVKLGIMWELYLFKELKNRPFVWKNDPKKSLFRMLGEVFFSLNGRNGLIYGQWVDMGNILKMTEGIRDFLIFCHFMGLFDAKFCPFFDFCQNFDLLCALKPQKIKKSLL